MLVRECSGPDSLASIYLQVAVRNLLNDGPETSVHGQATHTCTLHDVQRALGDRKEEVATAHDTLVPP